MGDDIAHRGPDGGAIHCEDGIGLAFRRLAILDLSAAASQPMSDVSGRCTLVFNGEIYNFRELRDELLASGAVFRTAGDAEVILQGYLRWGESVVERLRGMFALLLVDRSAGMALAARDGFGMKPLYFLERGALRGFASEMRPFWRLVAPSPDPNAIAELVTFGFAAGSLTNVREVARVEPGTIVRVPLAGGSVVRRRFCSRLPSNCSDDANMTLPEAVARTSASMRSSVAAHLIGDVPFAALLSGGVDSAFVAALAREHSRLRTFGVHVPDFHLDARPFRQQLARYCSLDHCEVTLDESAFADALPRAIDHLEGPSYPAASVMLMLLCERIRPSAKVVLTGEGADEIFGGYQRYASWRKLLALHTISGVPRSSVPDIWPFRAARQFCGRDVAASAAALVDLEALDTIFPAFRDHRGAREAVSAQLSKFRDRMYAVDRTANLEAMLLRQDRISMAASIESRVPFVDREVVTAADAIPRRLLIPGGVTKPVLKMAAAQLLPTEVVYQRKNGFVLPILRWMTNASGLGRYLDLLDSPNVLLAAYAERRPLQNAIAAFRRQPHQSHLFLWRLLNVELWLRSLQAARVRRAPRVAMPDESA
jgi:asparagine synthase (glutamine-hydrolysing)